MNRLLIVAALAFVVIDCGSANAQLFRRSCRPARCALACQPVVARFVPTATCSTGSIQQTVYTAPIATLAIFSDPGNYGHWCGANNTSAPNVVPIDGVDAVCKAHDLCLARQGHHCSCDAAFIRDMARASASSEHGEAYRIAAIAAFTVKPCFCTFNYPCCSCSWRGCSCRTCQGRYPGTGGQCGPRP